MNTPSRKTPSFPDDAKRLFCKWYGKLGKDLNEKENYLELPVSSEYRLFVKQYWIQQPGERPICYYVGYLLTREIYSEAGEYYLLNRGLSTIRFETVLSNIDTFTPIQVPLLFSLPKSTIGKPFDELSSMRLYGKAEYEQNYIEMCSSISINNIDDWFTRLFIAVNPNRLYSEYNLILSRERPRPESFEGTDEPQSTPEKTELFSRQPSAAETINKTCKDITPIAKHDSQSVRTTWRFCFVALVAILLFFCIVVLTRQRNGLAEDYDVLKSNIETLKDELKKLNSLYQKQGNDLKYIKEQCRELVKKNEELNDENIGLRVEIDSYKSKEAKYKELQSKYDELLKESKDAQNELKSENTDLKNTISKLEKKLKEQGRNNERINEKDKPSLLKEFLNTFKEVSKEPEPPKPQNKQPDNK